MIKKVVTRIILIAITVLVIIGGYYMLIDIESRAPEKTIEGITIETREFMSRKVFTISPENEKSEKVILYFHGGAYVQEATDKHWEFLQNLAKDTGATIIMPDYPLTPKYTYKDVLKMVEPLYKEIVEKTDSKNLIMMGDSAGGGLALGLAEKLSINNIELPSKTILISPWLDTTMANPEIKEVQPKDEDLNRQKLKFAGILYARNVDTDEEYFINPINGNLSKLKNIIIYTGTYDILNPDCHLLKASAQEVGGDIQIKEYEMAPHIWIINNNDDLARKAYQDILEDIK